MIWMIPPDVWKKNRDRLVRRITRKLLTVENNPGADSSRNRFDYVLTRAELALIIEDIMAETERLAIYHAGKPRV